jgi:hypothetical protein
VRSDAALLNGDRKFHYDLRFGFYGFVVLVVWSIFFDGFQNGASSVKGGLTRRTLRSVPLAAITASITTRAWIFASSAKVGYSGTASTTGASPENFFHTCPTLPAPTFSPSRQGDQLLQASSSQPGLASAAAIQIIMCRE